MSGHVQALAEASATHIGGFEPNSGKELDDFFSSLPDLYQGMGQDLVHAAQRLEGEHVHPNVLETLRELGAVLAGVSETAQQNYDQHLRDHALWLQD